MGAAARRVPQRVAWAASLLALSSTDRVLEVGCGNGVAAELIAQELTTGRVLAIDRSATAIERARRRLADHEAAGRAEVRQLALAALDPDLEVDVVLAVNVNLFWTSGADAECTVLAKVLRRGGVLHLVYEAPGGRAAEVAGRAAATVGAHGFSPTLVDGPAPGLAAVRATRLGVVLRRSGACGR